MDGNESFYIPGTEPLDIPDVDSFIQAFFDEVSGADSLLFLWYRSFGFVFCYFEFYSIQLPVMRIRLISY